MNENIKLITENYFNQKDTQFLDFKQGQDTKIGFRIGLMHAIIILYKDMENEFNSLKDFYGIELPTITRPISEKHKT